MSKLTSRKFKIEDEYVQGQEFILTSRQLEIGSEPQHVRLRVDAAGLVLYWDHLKSKRRDFVFVDSIVDSRIPKDEKTTLIVCCNRNFVSAQFFGFKCVENDEELVTRWADFIFQWTHWNKRQYSSVLRHMQRLFAPFFLDESAKYKRKNAYEHLNRPYDHVFRKFLMGSSLRSISSPDELLDVYLDKVQRPEVMQIFNKLKSTNQTTLTPRQFADFINGEQRDRRLNEEVHPPKSVQWVERTIRGLENEETSRLTIRGFMRYLLNESDLDSNMFRLKPTEMSHSISHYYCSSSHNSYLIGNQIHAANALLKDRFHDVCLTEVEIYRQILLAGCRCIELDCWDGPTGPVITHGPIALQKINIVPFEKVCEAIMDSGFKSSDYPIVLSLENHCSPPQQQQMARFFKEIFGEHLQDTPLPDFPLEPGHPLPSPNLLKQKILLKGRGPNSKKKPPPLHRTLKDRVQNLKVDVERNIRTRSSSPNADQMTSKRMSQITITEEISNISKDFMKDEAIDVVETMPVLAQQINYFQTTPVLSYDDPSYLMHSGSESKLDKMITRRSREFIQHSATHIVRCYPEILCNSSNFIPQYFWSAGVQMCALNFQTPGIEMQMNQTLFEENGQSGYVLKSAVLRDRTHKMSVHDKHICVANRLEISIKSAQLLNLIIPMRGNTITTSVRVDLYDLPNDTIIGKYRTAQSTSDGYNTLYLDNKFVFKKVSKLQGFPVKLIFSIIKPEHSMLHIRVVDENDEEIAQRFLVVHKIQAGEFIAFCRTNKWVLGFRHIILRNKYNQSEGPASVFAKIDVRVYVPAYQEELRDRYVDPLKEKNKREQERSNFSNPLKSSGKHQRKESKEDQGYG